MSKIITSGAKMQCSLGTGNSSLSVTSQLFAKISDALIATEADNKPLENVCSFGNCRRSSNNPPCMPSLERWQDTATENKINGLNKLTAESTLQCTYGGKISFVNSGSNSFIEGE